MFSGVFWGEFLGISGVFLGVLWSISGVFLGFLWGISGEFLGFVCGLLDSYEGSIMTFGAGSQFWFVGRSLGSVKGTHGRFCPLFPSRK